MPAPSFRLYSAMNKTSNQLDSVFKEVTEYFTNIPRITVTAGEGNPPEQYTVTYDIKGLCKESEGDIYSCDNHTVSISLPFGFPHFPPNCLPESPTFHPDFDSSAICIGDIWESDKSIVTLILHIGKMIAGEIYSSNNAFNEEAAEWYRNNGDQLPFDTIDFEAELPPADIPYVEKPIELDSIDTLDDNDFGDTFTLEDEPLPQNGIDVDRLRIIAKQKRFQALSRELQTISEEFEGRAELEQQIQTAMDQAMALFSEANTLEHEGKQKEAMEKYKSIEKLVSDYPMLQESLERVQQAFDLLGDWLPGSTDSSEEESAEQEEETAPPAPGKRTFFEETKAVSKKWLLIALGLGSVALLATLVFTYFSLGSNLNMAQKKFTECQTLLNDNDFQGAQKKCDEALSLTAEVRMVKQNEKEKLSREIRLLLASPKLRQGLAGKTLVNGKYVTKSTKELLLAFQNAKKNGDSFYKKELWSEAVNSYTKALNIAEKTTLIDAPLLAEVRQKLPRAQFNSIMLAGERYLATSDWEGANEQFGKALKLAKSNPNVLAEDITQLELLSNQSKFNTLRDQGHKAFNNGDWSGALTNYQLALDLVKKLDLAESDTIASLHENIAKTKIYMTIEKGKKAFAAAQWDDVIEQYEKAILLLEENSKLLSKINTRESRVKLSRIMLYASIIKDKQDVAKYLKSEKYPAAIEKLKNIQQSINSSQFAEMKEFKTILQEIASQIKDAEKEALLVEQSNYLTENFEKLFRKHYPAATRSVLSAPKVEYLKNIGDKILFRMQCTETAGGRPLRLQMDYLYSPATKSWSFYTEE